MEVHKENIKLNYNFKYNNFWNCIQCIDKDFFNDGLCDVHNKFECINCKGLIKYCSECDYYFLSDCLCILEKKKLTQLYIDDLKKDIKNK